MKILIADDSKVVRNSLMRLIHHHYPEMVIKVVSDVREAIFRVESDPPDLLLLDLQMPGGNGFDVMPAVRKSHHLILTIMLTNHSTPENRQRSKDEGVDYFLDKSGEFHRVIKIIGSHYPEPEHSAG